MSYDKPNFDTYIFPAQTLTADITLKVPIPTTKDGRVVDYGLVDVTTAVGGTGTATVTVGKTGELDRFGKALDVLGAAAGVGKTLRSTFTGTDVDAYNGNSIKSDDGDVIITYNAPATTPTGEAAIYCKINWAD